VTLSDVTRAFFERTAAIESAELAAAMGAILRDPGDGAADVTLSRYPEYNARLRTTCVATRVDGGHAENALPQRARAMLNCRIIPGDSPVRVLAALTQVVGDPGVTIRPTFDAEVVEPSPLLPALLGPIEEITHELWPAVPVIPTMGTTATDGFYLRRAGIPVYGVSGVFDDAGDIRAHGGDERIHETWFYDGLEFSYRLIKRLTGGE
jgi:acetylornithine deacetylase/succinyl-diaminopimelate desuccinylase-like protein